MSDDQPMKGSCQCGGVTYEITGKPLAMFVCHCTQCQKLSASAYSTTMLVKLSDLHVTGEMKTWERMSDSGRRNVAYFCPDCGNRIYHLDPEAPAFARFKAGTLDNAKMPVPDAHLWVNSKQPWDEIPEGIPSYPGNLPPEEAKKLFSRNS
ncbi:MAG: GFA family protein [Proteobacteria bacterium]|nr:GFA family protein [Pseudomonadota bacterium]